MIAQPDPDIPRALVSDVRWRIEHNYVVFHPQLRELLDAFDRLVTQHRADLRKIRRLEEKVSRYEQTLAGE